MVFQFGIAQFQDLFGDFVMEHTPLRVRFTSLPLSRQLQGLSP